MCLCLLVPSGVRRVARKPDCGVSNMNFIKTYVMKNRLVSIIMLWILATCACLAGKKARVVVAYVTSWTDIMPDPWAMTHINYAFGKVNETFDGVNISNPGRFKKLSELKAVNPKLKILLSVGGWGAGRFSEMAADEACRKKFAGNCRRLTEEYGLDGIDIDWEYPTQKSAGISYSPEDTQNFTLLMRDLRKVLGKKKLLTCATIASGEYIDFGNCIKYIDLVNVMSYDMASPPKHHSPLYASDISGWMTTDAAVKKHLEKGVPHDKLVVGMPFYGRGLTPYKAYVPRPQVLTGVEEKWSAESQVPYMTDKNGNFVLGFENVKSVTAKCHYIIEHDLRGAMYWEYADDYEQGDLRTAVAQCLLPNEQQGTRGKKESQ